VHQRIGTVGVERGAAPGRQARIYQAQGFALRRQRGLGHPQLLLQAAQLQLRATWCDVDLTARSCAARGQRPVGGAPAGADSAEQVELPARDETGAEVVADEWDAPHLARLAAPGAGSQVELGRGLGAGKARQRPRLVQVGRGDAQVGIGGQRRGHQRIELGILEAAPELRDRLLRGGGIGELRRQRRPVQGQRRRRRAGGEQAGQPGQGRPPPHGRSRSGGAAGAAGGGSSPGW
jgi:hypothetical protein